ncbi:MAG: hypothetical protein OEV85_00680 [Candidatus Thorarchaeota archaeon]|nr:hypothetical protein [Candidatus Thorarchaeota archaeon]
MGTFEEDFMLPPESSIQDAFDGIEHWTRVIPIGTKYHLLMGGNSAQLITDWQVGIILPINPLNPFKVLDAIKATSKSVVYMLIELTFTEMTNGVKVHAVLSGAIDRGMGDYRNLRTHLSTGSGIPDRAFDQYLTEQTKKHSPEPELRKLGGNVPETQQGSTQNCPSCNSEISISGIIRPDGFVVCPKCFKKFKP